MLLLLLLLDAAGESGAVEREREEDWRRRVSERAEVGATHERTLSAHARRVRERVELILASSGRWLQKGRREGRAKSRSRRRRVRQTLLYFRPQLHQQPTMGAVCGKSSDFQGEGQKLGGPSSAPPTSTRAPRTLASSSPAAGRATGGSAPAVEAGRREAMAKAAEERNKSVSVRVKEARLGGADDGCRRRRGALPWVENLVRSWRRCRLMEGGRRRRSVRGGTRGRRWW